MTEIREAALTHFADAIAEAKAMVAEDAMKGSDTGTCVLGAGIAAYIVPKRARSARVRVLIDAPFQGNLGSRLASERALGHLRAAGLDVFWCDGRMD